MFHACAVRFDVTENFEIFWKLNKTKIVIVVHFSNAPVLSCMGPAREGISCKSWQEPSTDQTPDSETPE
jgi:hypothetical protein